MSTQTREHPSNRLARGEARGFAHATDLAVQSAQYEYRLSYELDRKFNTPGAGSDTRAGLNAYETAAVRARGIYAGVMADVRPRIVAELRAAGLDDWADAYERDDYSGLAI